MDTTRISALLHAVDTGSLSGAARAMGYSPAGVLRLVDALEQELGVTLLERTAHGVSPTRACDALMEDLHSADEACAHLIAAAAALSSPDAGSVTVGCARSVAGTWLPPAIAAFGDAHPAVAVTIHEGGSPDLARLLDERVVDFCVGSRLPGREWLPLDSTPYVVLVPDDHPFARRVSLRVEELDREPVIEIVPARGSGTADLVRRAGIMPDVRFTTADTETARAMVAAGVGVCLTVGLTGQPATPGVTVVPVECEERFEFGVCHRGERGLTPAARELIATLQRVHG